MRNLLLICVWLPLFAIAQTEPKSYWIQFTDKNNTPYTLDQPLEFLSQRSLDRRSRQNIPLNEKDLPVNPNYIQQVLAQGATYLTHSKWFNSVSVLVPNDAIYNAIVALPFVLNSEQVAKREFKTEAPSKFDSSADAKITSQTDFSENDYGDAFNQVDMIGGVTLHNLGFRGEGMLIAVLDAGFPNVDVFSAFDSLRNEGRLIGGHDFVHRDNTYLEGNSHGQQVLSTMAGILPGQYMGTAPKASYLLLITEDADTEFPIEVDYWVAGAEYADSAGADVINSSLGYTTFQNWQLDYSYADMDGNTTRGAIGADIAASKGILVVNSAGNSGDDPWQYIGTPADGDSVLAIGSVSPEGYISNFSSIGPASDGDIKPNVCAQGGPAAVVNSSGSVSFGSGTSFAGPIMAGMAACLWQAHLDSATNMDVFHAIEKSAHKYQTPDHLYGYGIPNFAKANLILSGFNPADVDESELFPVYPNPFTTEIQGTFYAAAEQRVLIRLVNNLGQEIQRFEGTAQPYSGVTFKFSGLRHAAQGIYTVQIDADSGKFQKKVVKVTD